LSHQNFSLSSSSSWQVGFQIAISLQACQPASSSEPSSDFLDCRHHLYHTQVTGLFHGPTYRAGRRRGRNSMPNRGHHRRPIAKAADPDLNKLMSLRNRTSCLRFTHLFISSIPRMPVVQVRYRTKYAEACTAGRKVRIAPCRLKSTIHISGQGAA